MDEHIVSIRGHPTYRVSNRGYILNKNGHIMKQRHDKDGYCIVRIYDDGHYTDLKLHRVVAEHFIPNHNNLPQVNHKNGNKDDNPDTNLEWATDSDNTKHSYETNLHKVGAVLRHSTDGEIVRYKNAIEAASANGIKNPHNIRVAISRGTMSNGYYWSREQITTN